jgi:hypothetical protein
MVMNSTRAVAVRIHDVSPESVAATTVSASSAKVTIVDERRASMEAAGFLILLAGFIF